jgi:GAF domain-containing protein
MAALLLVPLVDGHRTVALLEVYRRSPQAWTNTQVDWASVLAVHVTAGLARVLPAAASPTAVDVPR